MIDFVSHNNICHVIHIMMEWCSYEILELNNIIRNMIMIKKKGAAVIRAFA